MIARNVLHTVFLVPMSSIGAKLDPPLLPEYRAFCLLIVSASAAIIILCGVVAIIVNEFKDFLLLLSFIFATCAAQYSEFTRRWHFLTESAAAALVTDLIRYCIQVVGIAILSCIYEDRFSSELAFLVIGVAALVGAAWGLRGGGWRLKRQFVQMVLPRHARYFRWIAPAVAFETIQGNVPFYIASLYLSHQGIGLLRALLSITNVMNLPYYTFQQISPGQAARAFHFGGDTSLRNYLRRLLFIGALSATALSAIVLMFNEVILKHVFNIYSSDAWLLLLCFCVLNIGLMARLPLQVAHQAREGSSVLFLSALIGAIAGVSLPFLLVPMLGELGLPLSNIAVIIVTAVPLAFPFRSARAV